MASPHLVVRSGSQRPLTVILDHELEVGRETDGLLLADTKMSRRHAVFAPVSSRSVRVTDLGSSNGTVILGSRIIGPIIVEVGETVTMGDTVIEVAAGGDDTATVGAGARRTEIAGITGSTSIDLVAESVRSGGFSAGLIGVGDDPGTLTIVFSDIEASTAQAVALGDTRWMQVLGHHTALVTAHVRAHRGRIVKNQGDGFMLCFSSARQALLCSIGLQRDLDRMATDQTELAVRVRIGLHTGEVLVGDDGDLFGRHVITAARIGAIADGATILVSSLVKQIAEPRGDIVFGPGEEMELKGIDRVTVVHEVDWQRSPVC